MLISGSGSNLQALLDAQPKINIVHVVSSRKTAYGLTRASIHNVPSTAFALKPYLTAHPGSTRTDYDAKLAEIVLELQPDLVVLAGWMHILSERFLQPLVRPATEEGKGGEKIPIINLHPALPGAFDGANAIARAHEAFEKGEIQKTGIMVHEVISEVDKGAPILVKEVEMVKGESIEALEERIHQVEHQLIVQATQQLVTEMKTPAVTN